MWLLFARVPPPDVVVWPGRRSLAVLDALAWPAAWILAVYAVPLSTGALGVLVCALAIVASVTRLHRALLANHRYHFTTIKWGSRLLVLLALGLGLKLALLLLSH